MSKKRKKGDRMVYDDMDKNIINTLNRLEVFIYKQLALIGITHFWLRIYRGEKTFSFHEVLPKSMEKGDRKPSMPEMLSIVKEEHGAEESPPFVMAICKEIIRFCGEQMANLGIHDCAFTIYYEGGIFLDFSCKVIKSSDAQAEPGTTPVTLQ